MQIFVHVLRTNSLHFDTFFIKQVLKGLVHLKMKISWYCTHPMSFYLSSVEKTLSTFEDFSPHNFELQLQPTCCSPNRCSFARLWRASASQPQLRNRGLSSETIGHLKNKINIYILFNHNRSSCAGQRRVRDYVITRRHLSLFTLRLKT